MTARPLFYDTETTGIKFESENIIELAAYDPVNKATFVQLINPGRPIPPEATAIHKITDEMVAKAPSFEQAALEFIKFCEGDVILIAHNNDTFDLPFMREEFKRCGIAMPSWRFLDSLKWARRYRPDLPRHTLQFLREMYEIPPNNAHRALDDVMVLYQVFSFLTDDISIDTAYNLLHRPKSIQHMPFGKYQNVPIAKVPADYVNWLSKNGVFEKEENKELRLSFEKIGLLPLSA
jgi:DNA polymerase-3 subunit epsilon